MSSAVTIGPVACVVRVLPPETQPAVIAPSSRMETATRVEEHVIGGGLRTARREKACDGRVVRRCSSNNKLGGRARQGPHGRDKVSECVSRVQIGSSATFRNG